MSQDRQVYIGNWPRHKEARLIPVNTLEELRGIIKREKIVVPKKIKLGTLWGRKWINWFGINHEGKDVYLVDKGYYGD